jgi:predicted enzyme related to lactoylglutathione lyase
MHRLQRDVLPVVLVVSSARARDARVACSQSRPASQNRLTTSQVCQRRQHGKCFVLLIREGVMANTFGTDILIQAADPMEAAKFYVKELGFEVTDEKSDMVSLHGNNINFFIERGPSLGPVLEVTVKSVKEAKARLQKKGCQIVKDEPDFPRCYVKDPNGLIYNLTE